MPRPTERQQKHRGIHFCDGEVNVDELSIDKSSDWRGNLTECSAGDSEPARSSIASSRSRRSEACSDEAVSWESALSFSNTCGIARNT
jgi:hypothetical protein